MAQPEVGQRLVAAEYLFSVSSEQRLEKRREIREGAVEGPLFGCEADNDHREHECPLVDQQWWTRAALWQRVDRQN